MQCTTIERIFVRQYVYITVSNGGTVDDTTMRML